jgi:hypothetical protein
MKSSEIDIRTLPEAAWELRKHAAHDHNREQ